MVSAVTKVLSITELATQILSYSGLKEVQRMRSLSRKLRDIIDDPGNGSLIFSMRITAAIDRLARSHVFPAANPVKVLDAVVDFTNQRGLDPSHPVRSEELKELSRQWLASHYRTEVDKVEDQLRPVTRLGLAMINLHIQLHLTDIQVSAGSLVPTGIREWTQTAVGRARQTDVFSAIWNETPLFEEWFGRIRRGCLFSEASVLYEGTHAASGRPPKWPLTRLIQVHPEYLPTNHTQLLGVSTVEQLKALLHTSLPTLPEAKSYFRFAYCVKSQWAYDQVQKAVSGRAAPMDWMTKARVIEELYLY